MLGNKCDHVDRDRKRLEGEREALGVEIGELKAEARENRKKNQTLSIRNNQLQTERDRITSLRKEAEYEKNLTVAGVDALTREIEHLRKDTDQDKKKIIDLIRFRDMMSKSIKKAEGENYRNKDEIQKKNTEIGMLKQ